MDWSSPKMSMGMEVAPGIEKKSLSPSVPLAMMSAI